MIGGAPRSGSWAQESSAHCCAGLEGMRGTGAGARTGCVRTVSAALGRWSQCLRVVCSIQRRRPSVPCPCSWEACARLSPSGRGPPRSREVAPASVPGRRGSDRFVPRHGSRKVRANADEVLVLFLGQASHEHVDREAWKTLPMISPA